MNFSTGSSRYEALDALRGLAATSVVISHLTPYGLMSSPSLWAELKWLPLRLLWGGHQAVILFFVLSGFSLYLMMEATSATRHGIRGYVLARIARLYPTYVAALLFVGSILYVVGTPPDIDLRGIISHVFMIGRFNTDAINPPIWSIVHEMRISLIFPLLFLAVRGMPAVTMSAMTILSLSAASLMWTHPELSSGSLGSFVATAHYATFFAAGAVLARNRHGVLGFMRHIGIPCVIASLLVALTLYAYPFDNPWNAGQRMAGDLLIGAGAVALIAIVAARPELLSFSLFRFLGRISYSMYLVHFGCIALAKHVSGGENHPALIWILALALTVFASWMINVLVEAPSQKWVRRIRRPLRTDAI